MSGAVGTRLGPVTVRTGARSVSVIPDAAAVAMGVRVVDAEGRPMDTAVNGSRLYFEVPEGTPDGTASVTVQGATKVPVGRVFTSGVPAQAQIVAGSSESAAAARATALWPQPPVTQAGTAQGTTAGSVVEALGAPSAAVPATSPDEERLATSGSSAATPVIASLAVGLVVLGGLVVLLLRKRPLEEED